MKTLTVLSTAALLAFAGAASACPGMASKIKLDQTAQSGPQTTPPVIYPITKAPS